MAVRSVPVKRHLVQMVETQFPGFRFVSESGGTYGFVREKPGFWYEYLPIDRYFEDGKGDLSINWYLIGGGYVPDWYDWTGLLHMPWRVSSARGGPPNYLIGQLAADPNEPPSLLTSPGPMEPVRYQTGPQKQLPQALEVLRDKLERYAIPALEAPLKPAEERRLVRWRLLAERILPQIAALELRSPEAFAELKAWHKQKARRWKESVDINNHPIMSCWREEISQLPGFAEEWDSSPTLREWVFNWFTHAMLIHP